MEINETLASASVHTCRICGLKIAGRIMSIFLLVRFSNFLHIKFKLTVVERQNTFKSYWPLIGNIPLLFPKQCSQL